MAFEVGQGEVEGVSHDRHVWGAGVTVYARSKATGVVHEEHDLPVTHVLRPKSEDRGERSQKLKSIDVLTSLRVGNHVGVEAPRYTRDATPRLNQPPRAQAPEEPAMTEHVLN